MEIRQKTEELIMVIKSFQLSHDLAVNDYKKLTGLFNDAAFRLYTERTHQALAIYNFVEARYEYISSSVATFCPSFKPGSVDAGPDLLISMMKPLSTDAMINKITPRMLEACQQYRKNICDLRFSACVQINSSSANIEWVLLQSSMLCATPEGFPILSFSVINDVTSIKKDPFVHYTAHLVTDNTAEVLYCETVGDRSLTGITKREIEVIQLIAKGQTTKEIADTLFISYETAKKHRSNILEKMNCVNAGELLNKATVMGLV